VDRNRVAKAIAEEAPGVRIDLERPMSEMTSLSIGGPADILITPSTAAEVSGAMRAIRTFGADLLALGGGSNLLVRDTGIRGVVMHMSSLRDMKVIKESGGEVTVHVGAGLPLGRLLGFARREGFSGLEGLSGIPGYVGGAISGNAGSFGSEMMDVVSEVDIIAPDGTSETMGTELLTPVYRSSGIPKGSVILGARLILRRDDRASVAARMDEALSIKKRTQPLRERSAGCVFRNPEGDSAGRLIDASGCKGMSEGPVEVSHVHAGFFINRGGGTARDFLRLMEKVSARVNEEFGTVLEPEIKVVGSDA